MNIVDVVISKVKAQADGRLFEINSILADPTKKDAVEDLVKAINVYGCHCEFLKNAERLKTQMEQVADENKDNPDNS